MTKRTARLMGKLAALRVDRGIEKSAGMEKEAVIGIGALLAIEAAIAGLGYGGKKAYDWYTAPKEQRGLSPAAQKMFQGTNVDTRHFAPLKLPEGITEHDKKLMSVYGFTPQSIVYHKHMLAMKKEREAAAKKKQEATTADAAKPVSLSDYFKQHPQLGQLLDQLPQRQSYRAPSAPPWARARGGMASPPRARERGGMAFPTREHEAGFWKKQTQGTPGRVGAERDVMRTGNTNRLRTDQYISRVNELFGQGGALA